MAPLAIHPDDRDWVDDQFESFLRLFGAEDLQQAPVHLPDATHFPEAYAGKKELLHPLFTRIAESMNADPDAVPLVWVDSDNGEEINLSEVEEDGESSTTVYIESDLIREPEGLVYEMAGQLSYLILDEMGMVDDSIIPEEVDDDFVDLDILKPDLFATYYGYGVFVANSAEAADETDEDGFPINDYPGISPEVAAYALALCSWLKKDEQASWREVLSPVVRPLYDQAHNYFFGGGSTRFNDTLLENIKKESAYSEAFNEAFEAENFSEALALTEAALAESPKDTVLAVNRAMTLLAMERVPEAKKLLEELAVTAPETGMINYYIGLASLMMGDMEGATAALQRSRDLGEIDEETYEEMLEEMK